MLDESDSGMLSPGWAAADVSRVSDRAWITAALRVESALQAAVDREAPGTSDYVHVGATSQDILGSASMLVCAEALLPPAPKGSTYSADSA